MLEFEKKILLHANEYRFLKEHRYIGAATAVQINHYYDTDDFALNKTGITCRVREKDGNFTATIKQHLSDGQNRSVETSRPARDRWDGSLFKSLGAWYQGCLETTRTVFVLCDGVQVMLDKNRYLDTVDYELEIEYDPQAVSKAVRELNLLADSLAVHGIIRDADEFRGRVGKGKSKSGRFFQRKAEQNEFWKEGN